MYRNEFHYRRLLEIPLLLALAAALLAGCATQFAEDVGDPCATERAELRGAQDYYTKSVLAGAATGAAVGAAAGALTAVLTGSNVAKGALIGGAGGAVLGAVGGYYKAKQQDAADAAALSGSILKDVQTENSEIDRATLAFARLRNCRFTAAQQVKSEFAAGRISRAQASSRLDEVKERFNRDLVIADEIGTKMTDRGREFEYASNQLVAADPNAKVYLTRYPLSPVESQPATSSSVKAKTSPKARTPATVRTKTRVAKTPKAPPPPPSAAPVVAVAQETNTNQIKQKKYSNEMAVAKAESSKAFSLEGQVGLILPPCLACGSG